MPASDPTPDFGTPSRPAQNESSGPPRNVVTGQQNDGSTASRLPRSTIYWIIGAVLLLLALAATIGSVNRDVYSARGVVTGYLQALSAHDASAALAVPGVRMPAAQMRAARLSPTASSELLRNDLLAPLSDVSVTGDRRQSNGSHRVTVRYTIGTEATATSGTSTFTVRPAANVLGIFQTWEFSVSPLAETRLTVLHGSQFSAGPETLNTRAANPDQRPSAFTTQADYLVFVPSLVIYSVNSTMLKAAPVGSLATRPLSINSTTVDAQPTPTFIARINTRARAMLAACTTQKVLMPTGCPFGATIDNRVLGTPTWTMTSYPRATVIAGRESWEIPAAKGTAHIVVRVQSLFDGSISTQSTEEPFTLSASEVVIDSRGMPEFAFDS